MCVREWTMYPKAEEDTFLAVYMCVSECLYVLCVDGGEDKDSGSWYMYPKLCVAFMSYAGETFL